MRKEIHIKTDKLFTDITDQVSNFSKDWGESGIVNVYSMHSTASIWLTENELLHQADVRFFLDKIVPYQKNPEGDQKNIKYLHDLISLRKDVPSDERVNGHSHLRSMFFNSSENVPIEKGELLLGEWKKIFFIELDPVRDRKIICSFIKL